MAQACMAMLTVVAVLCLPATGRSEPCACCGCKVELVPAPQERASRAERELTAVLASGIAVTAASYILGVMVARGEPHPVAAVDMIPIAGPIAAASRSPQDTDKASLLAFFGGAQAMGLLVIAAAATDLAERHRMLINASVGPNGCSASVTWRLP